jgi:hypothetical protein
MAYYNQGDLQPVHAADAWNLDRYLFTATAYIARAGKKDGSSYNEDVLKALWFLAYALTKNSKYAETVVHVCKGLMHELREEETGNTSTKLSSDVSITANTGNVSDDRELCRETESELVREKSIRTLYGPSKGYS